MFWKVDEKHVVLMNYDDAPCGELSEGEHGSSKEIEQLKSPNIGYVAGDKYSEGDFGCIKKNLASI